MGEFLNFFNLGVKAFDWTNSRNSLNSHRKEGEMWISKTPKVRNTRNGIVNLNISNRGRSVLQIITLTVNSALKEGTQSGCNVQHRFSAIFQALYANGVHKNERLAM